MIFSEVYKTIRMKLFGVKITNAMLIMLVLGIFLGVNMVGSTSRVSPREAFTMFGAPVGEKTTADVYGNWISRQHEPVRNPHETIQQGRTQLSGDQLDILAENKFSPECCGHDMGYSSSQGCACLTSEQRTLLGGGNCK